MPAARTTVLTTAAATVKVREGMSLLSVSETSAGRPTCGERTDRPHTCHFGQTQGVTPQDRSGSKESSHAYPYRCRCAGRVSAVADRPDGAPADGALLAGPARPGSRRSARAAPRPPSAAGCSAVPVCRRPPGQDGGRRTEDGAAERRSDGAARTTERPGIPCQWDTRPFRSAHRCQRATALVALLVAEPLAWPVRRAVTFTVIFLPRWADLRVSEDLVAPEIALPLAYHW